MKRVMLILVVVLASVVSFAVRTDAAEEGLIALKWRSEIRVASQYVVVDVNGDGIREVIAPLAFPGYKTPGENVFALDGRNGRKIWGTEAYSDVVGRGKLAMRRYSPWAISLGDMRDDGKHQLIIGTLKGWTVASLDLKTGKLLAETGGKKHRWLSFEKLAQSALILDLDKNPGREAVMVSRSQGKMHIFDADLKEVRGVTRPGNFYTCGSNLSALDVDGDHVFDIFVGSGDDWKPTPGQQGKLIRYKAGTFEEQWCTMLGDNASSSDPVIVDCDGDGKLEILNCVDNYGGKKSPPVNKLFCFDLDGNILWSYAIEQEDSVAVADMDFDGIPEIVGMGKHAELYCLNVIDGKPVERWRVRAPVKSTGSKHNQLTPAIGDLDGDRELEIITATTDYVSVFDVNGKLLDSIPIDRMPDAYNISLVDVDEDDMMEAVIGGTGGVIVVDTKGYGPLDDRITCKRDYRRNNDYGWNYQDTYFTYRVAKAGVRLLADTVALDKDGAGKYIATGSLTTAGLALPKGFRFAKLVYGKLVPKGTSIRVDVLGPDGRVVKGNAASGADLNLTASPIRLRFTLAANHARTATPELHDYVLQFDRPRKEN